METLLPKAILLALLRDDAEKLLSHRFFQNEVRRPRPRIGNTQQVSKFPPGFGDRNWPPGRDRRPAFGLSQLIDEITQLLGKTSLAAPRSPSSDLKSDRVEPGVIPFGMAFQQRFHMICCSHRSPPPLR